MYDRALALNIIHAKVSDDPSVIFAPHAHVLPMIAMGLLSANDVVEQPLTMVVWPCVGHDTVSPCLATALPLANREGDPPVMVAPCVHLSPTLATPVLMA